MPDSFERVLDAAIELELNVSRLYRRFHHALVEDSHFWWELCLEEKNHANLLRSAAKIAAASRQRPVGLLPDTIEELTAVNRRIEGVLAQRPEEFPRDRAEAFRLAVELEGSVGELHFQRFMAMPPANKIGKVFQDLNRDDKDHEVRILRYMEQHGIG